MAHLLHYGPRFKKVRCSTALSAQTEFSHPTVSTDERLIEIAKGSTATSLLARAAITRVRSTIGQIGFDHLWAAGKAPTPSKSHECGVASTKCLNLFATHPLTYSS